VPLGCYNLHASLLPRWRGAAPIHRAIMAGDPATGVMAMKMEEGLDTGPVGGVERVAITPDMTTGELHDKLARLGADLMLRSIGALERGALTLTPQSADGVTYASKIDKNESRIDWTMPWNDVHNHIRGLSPFPGGWFELNGESGPVRVKVLRSTKGEGKGAPGQVIDDRLTIACADGAIRILELQRAGKQPMKADEYLRGLPLAAGAVVS
jgi:methionyl-tRNA formyltransferase